MHTVCEFPASPPALRKGPNSVLQDLRLKMTETPQTWSLQLEKCRSWIKINFQDFSVKAQFGQPPRASGLECGYQAGMWRTPPITEFVRIHRSASVRLKPRIRMLEHRILNPSPKSQNPSTLDPKPWTMDHRVQIHRLSVSGMWISGGGWCSLRC